MLSGKTTLAILGGLLFIGGGFLGVRMLEQVVINSYRRTSKSAPPDKEIQKRVQELEAEKSRKAEANKRAIQRDEAYFTAVKRHDRAAMRRLQKHKTSASLAMCRAETSPAEAILLLSEGARLDYKDDTGMTALENHVYFANVPMVKWLLARNASPKFGTPEWTLMVARKRSQLDTYSLQSGADYTNEVASLKALEAVEKKVSQGHRQAGLR
jgi:hypothetical protein